MLRAYPIHIPSAQWVVEDYDATAHRVGEADEKFGKTGYKTIGVAVAEGDGPMKYVGTLPIMDPPRHDTAETIRKIKGADVEVKMITGDHLNIARELARQIRLGVNIFPNTDLWPASFSRDDLITEADGFAQVGIASALFSLHAPFTLSFHTLPPRSPSPLSPLSLLHSPLFSPPLSLHTHSRARTDTRTRARARDADHDRSPPPLPPPSSPCPPPNHHRHL